MKASTVNLTCPTCKQVVSKLVNEVNYHATCRPSGKRNWGKFS